MALATTLPVVSAGILGARFPRPSGIALILILHFALHACTVSVPLQGTAPILRDAANFDRASFSDPESASDVRRAGNLRGTHCCNSGWAEYDFASASPGWYELWAHGGALETIVDPPTDAAGEPAAYFTEGSGVPRDPDKIGNVWLSPAAHRIRFQTELWNGFSDLRSFELRPSTGTVESNVSITWPRAGSIYRANECPALELRYGGLKADAVVILETTNRSSQESISEREIALSAATDFTTLAIPIACKLEGHFRVSLAEIRSGLRHKLEDGAVKGFDYEVVDVQHPPPMSASLASEKYEIDCISKLPEYASAETSLRSNPGGSVRESGSTGWYPYLWLPAAQRNAAPRASWFAYALPTMTPGRRYRIDVGIPDDTDSTFGIILREARQHAYPMAIGVDTGGPYANTGSTQSASLEFWARAAEARLVFTPVHDGTRAACRHIRVSSIEPNEPSKRRAPSDGKRTFFHWFEEGINFIDLFGAVEDDPVSEARAADRWAGRVAEFGGTTLMPTVLVYGGQLYPSAYNVMEMYPQRDPLRRMVLSAERFGLKIIPELHPRSDELVAGLDEDEARKRLLVSKDGTDDFFKQDGRTRNRPPHYNILLPGTQDWLIKMVGELADRYRDSPALAGVSLRYMNWANSALDNLVDLGWGYNDEIVQRFARETGNAVPALETRNPDRFAIRYAWLTGPGLSSWADWRCQQITDLLVRLSHRIQQSRPDLILYLHVFPFQPDEAPPFSLTDTPTTRLRQAGIDPGAISRIPGVVLLDSSARYGRTMRDAQARGLLDAMRKPEIITNLIPPGSGGRFISTQRYIEATDEIIPPGVLGLPASTRATWTSLAANPPGRQALERFALQVAYGDALTIGDGGNGNTLDTPALASFLAEFTALPSAHFEDTPYSDGAVTVRTGTGELASWAYAVNRSNAVAHVSIPLIGNGSAARPSKDVALNVSSGALEVDLIPFELIALHFTGSLRVALIATSDMPR